MPGKLTHKEGFLLNVPVSILPFQAQFPAPEICDRPDQQTLHLKWETHRAVPREPNEYKKHSILVFWTGNRGASEYVRFVCFIRYPSLSLKKRDGSPAWTCISALNCSPAPFFLLGHSGCIRYWSHFAAVYASKIQKNPENLGDYLHVCIHGARSRYSWVDIGVSPTSGLTRCRGRKRTKKNKDFNQVFQ